jgi:hypothetical protein
VYQDLQRQKAHATCYYNVQIRSHVWPVCITSSFHSEAPVASGSSKGTSARLQAASVPHCIAEQEACSELNCWTLQEESLLCSGVVLPAIGTTQSADSKGKTRAAKAPQGPAANCMHLRRTAAATTAGRPEREDSYQDIIVTPACAARRSAQLLSHAGDSSPGDILHRISLLARLHKRH